MAEAKQRGMESKRPAGDDSNRVGPSMLKEKPAESEEPALKSCSPEAFVPL